MLDIKIDPVSKKATVTFTCEIDLTHPLRTEKVAAHVVHRDASGNQLGQYETIEEAANNITDDTETLKEFPAGEKRCCDDETVEQHIVREAHEAMSLALAAHSAKPDDFAERRKKLDEEEAKHAAAKPKVNWGIAAKRPCRN